MTTLKKVKTALNFLKKNNRVQFQNVLIQSDGLICTDLESTILIKNNFNLKQGFQNISTLGLLDSVENETLTDAFYNVNFEGNETTMYTDTVKLFSVKRLEHMLKFCSKDETRVMLNGIALNDGHLVAIDGHTACFNEIKGIDKNNSYIIPRTSISKLITLCKMYKIENVTIRLDDTFGMVENSQFIFKMRLIQRDFPNWQTILPAKYANELQIDNWVNVKDIKPLLNERTHSVKLKEIENNLVLICPLYPDNQYIIGKCSIKDFEIGFNINYLERASNNEKSFNFKFNNELAPCLVNDSIIMPLKL